MNTSSTHRPTARPEPGASPRPVRCRLPGTRLVGPPLAAVVLVATTLASAMPARAAGEIYRAVQPDGTVVFSDRREPDAIELETRTVGFDTDPADAAGDPDAGGAKEPPTRAAPLATETKGTATDDASIGEIDRVVIASPPPDATLLDPVGPLLIEVGTSPGSLMASGLVAEVRIDGETVATGASSTVAVPPPDRGEHALQVRLVDLDGRVIVESSEQALHVRRTAVASEVDGEN